jgi:hypothetical protein
MKQYRSNATRLACALVAFLLCLSLSQANAQSVDWEKTHGNATSGYAVQRLDDGGFIAVGAGGNWPSTQGYVIRINADGNKIWEKNIGTGNPGVWVASVKKTADGQVAIVGSKNSMPWLWKYDLDGNEKWDRQLMGPFSYGDARSVVTVPDGIVVTGANSVAGKYNVFVHKFSLAGDSLWSLQMNAKGSDGYGIRQVLDGNFLIAGRIDKGDGYESYVLKVSSAGAVMWEKSYAKVAGTFGDEAHDVAVASDGYLVVGSHSVSTTNSRMEAIKITLDGVMSWRKQYGSPEYSGFNAVRPTTDGFIVVGYSGTSQITKAHIMKLDQTGGVAADKELEASFLHYVDQAVPPTKYVVVGGTMDFSKMYLARVDMSVDVPVNDEFTYIYNYNNQPLYAFKNSKGWVGEGAGWIKLKAALDTVRVNELLRFAVTKFRLDTSRTSATGPISFQMDGYVLTPDKISTKWKVIGFTESNGWIDKDGMHFNDPIRDPNKGIAGTRLAVDRITIESYPNTPSFSLWGTMLVNGIRDYQKNSEKISFGGFKLSNNAASGISMSLLTEPGVVYSPTGIYHPEQDSLSLVGLMYSDIYFTEGVQPTSYIKNGELGPLNLLSLSSSVPFGGDFARIRGMKGVYMPWYMTLFGTKIPLGWAAFVNGTVFSLLTPSLYEITLPSAAMIAPGELHEDEASYRMYKVGSKWNVEGSGPVKMTWTPWASMEGKLGEGSLKMGAKDNGEFLFYGNGKLNTFVQQGSSTYTSGRAVGQIQVPISGLVKNYLVFATMLQNLIGTAPKSAKVRFADYKGTAEFPDDPMLMGMSVKFDLSKSVNDAGFATLPEDVDLSELMTRTLLVNGTKAKSHEKSAINEFNVPENARGIWIGVKGIAGPATTTLQSPSGKLIEQTTPDSTILKWNGEDNTHFWAVASPEAGMWLINTTQGRDTVEVLVFKALPSFELSTSQQGKSLTVNWTSPSTDSIDLFLDTDGEGFDGIYVATVPGSTGTTQFTLPNGVTECSYHLYAERRYAATIQSDYAETTIDNSNGRLAGPTTWATSYNSTDKTANVSWQVSSDAAVAGYVIRLRGNGIDSVLATQFANASSVTFPVADPNGLFVAIMPYDTNGNRGCWSEFLPLSTSDVEQDFAEIKTLDAVVLPNPSRGRASLYLRTDESSDVRITIFDAAGRSMSTFTQHYSIGEHDVELETSTLPSGSYVVIVEAGDRRQVRNFVIAR